MASFLPCRSVLAVVRLLSGFAPWSARCRTTKPFTPGAAGRISWSPVEPKTKDEAIRQILSTWNETRQKFDVLREQVRRTETMSALKTQNTSLYRERERLFRDLGEEVWKLVRSGKIGVPPELNTPIKAVALAEERRRIVTRQITDILKEGEEVAAKLRAGTTKGRAPHSGVETRGKKR